MENNTEIDIEKYKYYCSVGDLLDFIEEYNIPRDSKILVQRIEDVYFEKHNWETIKKVGIGYESYSEIKQKAINGEYNDKSKYPKMTEEMIEIYKNLNLNPLLEEYIPVWSPVYFVDSKDLYLDCHY